MDAGKRDTLKRLMAAMAAGDRGAIFQLRVVFDVELRGAVRQAATEVGRRLPSDEVEAVATDFCTWLAGHAGAWRPDGALPWRWAWAHLTTEVRKNQGFWPLAAADPCGHEIEDSVALDAPMDDEILCTFERAARSHHRVAQVLEVLEATSDPRDIALDARVHRANRGGRSVAVPHDRPSLRAEPERREKRVQRARDRARAFIAERPELADLTDLPVFSGRRPQRRSEAA